ncbi:TnsA endonuclease C-terminal domain-containing protein [Mitsuaria sp. 7]|uniref:TnsA endonuclease C-terminal domain-containing protein n=1 Tax=Mitsuaria sp. 7 TaxID=1658665 RepID=UPI0018D2D2EF|nr:TnsA endonuclease C-terminal domain-containing protein [Mitsuaria sp. 7]
MSEEDILEYQKMGRGKGRLATYLPWLYTTEGYYDGTTHEPYSERFGRNHQLLSDGEQSLFYILERAVSVTDVREQFPLDRELTQEVANSLGVKHQFYKGTYVPYVMTVDFLVDRSTDEGERIEAYEVKVAHELESPRVVELLEVMRESLAQLGIPLHLVVKELLPAQKVKNLGWIRRAQKSENAIIAYDDYFEEYKLRMTQELRAHTPEQSLSDYCEEFDRRNGIDKGTGLRVARMLLNERILYMDLNNAFPERLPMSTFRILAPSPTNKNPPCTDE